MILQEPLILGFSITFSPVVSDCCRKLISTCLLTVFPSMPRAASPQQCSEDFLHLSVHRPSGQLVPAYKLRDLIKSSYALCRLGYKV